MVPMLIYIQRATTLPQVFLAARQGFLGFSSLLPVEAIEASSICTLQVATNCFLVSTATIRTKVPGAAGEATHMRSSAVFPDVAYVWVFFKFECLVRFHFRVLLSGFVWPNDYLFLISARDVGQDVFFVDNPFPNRGLATIAVVPPSEPSRSFRL